MLNLNNSSFNLSDSPSQNYESRINLELFLKELYQTNKFKNIQDNFSHSITICKTILEDLLFQMENAIIEKQLDKRMKPISFSFLRELTQISLNLVQNEETGEKKVKDIYQEEFEPIPPIQDTWISQKLQIKLRDKEKLQLVSSSKKKYNQVFVSSKQYKDETVSQLDVSYQRKINDDIAIDLSEPIRISKQEEILRQEKEQELLLKIQNEQKEKLKKKQLNEQQQKWNKMKKENKFKNYTFDYDGTMILIAQNVQDKLPPVEFPTSYDIKSPIKIVEKKKGSLKYIQKPLVKNPKSSTVKGEFNIKENQFITGLEDFEMTQGVTLTYEGGVKKGIFRPTTTIDDLMSKTLRISKSDYLYIVKAGNLSREQFQQTLDNNRFAETAKEQTRKKEVKFSEKAYKTDTQFPKFKPSSTQQSKRSFGTIRIQNKSFFDTLSSQNIQEEKVEYSKKIELSKKPQKNVKQEYGDELDVIDKFNFAIMKSKDWGIGSINHNQLLMQQPIFVKPTVRSIKSSLGLRNKQPRDRIILNNNNIPKSSQTVKRSKIVEPLQKEQKKIVETIFEAELSKIEEKTNQQ